MKKQQYPQRTAVAMALGWALLHFAPVAQAQVPPDAGQTLQQLQPPIAPPRESQPLKIQAPLGSAAIVPGGATVVLRSLKLTGNSVVAEEALRAVLGDVTGKTFDLAGLRGLAQRITDFYQASGYPFARAILPPQDLEHGDLRIDVIEGRYGAVQAECDDSALAQQATAFLDGLRPGSVITSGPLERATLLLDDLPGIQTNATMRPGTLAGTGDLIVQVARDQRVRGDIGLDNAGSRYTGKNRVRANVDINSPFLLGDQLTVRALLSEEKLWLGSLGYSLPLGASGLRGNVAYSHTSYELAKEFASLHANGTAKVASAGLSYPILRSQKANLTLIATYQSKDLHDNRDSTQTYESKSSQSMPLALQFDYRDVFDGITYGSVSWTPGKLKLDAGLTAVDDYKSNGRFHKVNLDVVRLQSLPAGFNLMAHLSWQQANKNLDSSEKLSLGGASGVRAYPSGEATGDEGGLAQLELRYDAGAYTPYAFMDAGRITVNAKPVVAGDNRRSLSGGGLGLRYQRQAWSADVALAWRTIGGRSLSETNSDPKPRVWLNLEYRF
ncbi:ShlB/FhaC/HecB family hemolysin secretion/activation protein [Janthinobacterium sp. SUN073]|uniref:ShlB/FhaC/HecB family hemolysin secretion/activation protein n=1 Tax=Janthinobacterium sp. SUN073 TaxID=3004102 RepID=UPI0025AFB9CD|nr:ShlB/FhaC/HecB family hemolysin secretion/activation protein [Janthinobacterium sp. SUN073]MDN2698655.1 ShlB/FhaC/HecB family hemolysin secretion/activation protein [Janthinobacterium sp. SUN073]